MFIAYWIAINLYDNSIIMVKLAAKNHDFRLHSFHAVASTTTNTTITNETSICRQITHNRTKPSVQIEINLVLFVSHRRYKRIQHKSALPPHALIQSKTDF